MKVFKFLLSFLITAALIYLLDHSWIVKGNRLPPLGKFLDPFHGFWQNIEPKSDSSHTEPLNIPGLKEPVTIVFDSLMIPHIFANNDEDLYLAQGYITARHRLWQMEIQTHAAAGRVSEIVGSIALESDRASRRLGMVYGAEKALTGMMKNPTTKMMVEKYTEGVNAYINSLEDKDLPFEYKLLDYKPEPWTTFKCALLLKNMAKTLCMGDKDMEMTNALTLYGKDIVDLLYPDREPVGDPIVDNTNGWKFKPIAFDTVPRAIPNELINVKKIPPSDPTTGSNNWAVSGSKTATGAPILCGDPHLNLSLPSLWYVVQLHAPGTNAMGASLPGSPAIIIGFTDSVAWSVTNAQRDLVDWYAIEFENSKRDKYMLDGKWTATKKVVEQFNVRGAEIFYDTVVYTHWGPVTYDETFQEKNNRKQHAFRWMAHDESEELMTFYKLNRAKNYKDYSEALNHYSTPPQNFVFAAASGDIAMRIQGKFPIRRLYEGKFVLDGSKTSNGWQAYIPNDQNVQYKNPARGFVSSANQYPVDATYPYYVTGVSFEAYRNRRINAVLTASDSITVNDMMKLQNDNFNLKASESLPVFLSLLDTTHLTPEEAEAYKILKSWNYINDKDSPGAAYYEAWWNNLMPLTWDELEKNQVTLSRPTTYNTIRLIKEKPDLSFFDIAGTPEKETARDVIRKAFALGVQDIREWETKEGKDARWGAYKDSYIGHLLRLEPLSVHVLAGGNRDIVNAHSKTHGPSWRMIVSLEKSGAKAWGVYPGGQSGNPGSAHYVDMLDSWVAGKYYPMLFMHKSDAPPTTTSLQLNPESK
ncbi:MAG TPA: penicillin acylase family protein [Ohtaekwangia sp.]|uniref:penicillin acylase family protein n=1 Tax=Ohtaekwangia sp. TaxID=2066019 RepID=UPI002F95913D